MRKVVVAGVVVLVLAAALGERPGIAAALNAVIVGSSFDLFDRRLHFAPHLHGAIAGLALIVGGVATLGLASALYIGASFGAWPRLGLTHPPAGTRGAGGEPGARFYVSSTGTSARSAAVSESSLRNRSSRASQSFIAKAPTVTLSRVPHSGQRQ